MRMPHVTMPDELGQRVLALCEERAVSYAALVREGLTTLLELELQRAINAARAGSPRRCVVCREPRQVDPLRDSMAHAQCDQKIADLERRVTA